MTSSDGATYRYGHSVLAGDRLRLLASIFEPTTRSFLERAALAPGRAADVAVDLGCGPGYTTALLAAVVGARETVGVELSAAFVTRARDEHERPGVRFVQHDVTSLPLPLHGVAPDVLYARYLLSHLQDPLPTAERWAAALAPSGRLLVEEVERITTHEPTFDRYLALTAAVLAADGTDLYVGSTLATAAWGEGVEVVDSHAAHVAPPTADVATMFAMNFVTWRESSWMHDNVTTTEADEIATTLDELRASAASSEITWTLRQLALMPVSR